MIEENINELKQKARQRQLDFENQMKKSEEDLDKRFSKIKPEPIFDWKRRKSTL